MAWLSVTIVALMMCTVAMVRSIVLDEVAGRANADVVQELDEFRHFAAEGIDPATSQPFASASDLLTAFMNRQIPGDNEIFLGVLPHGLIQPDFSGIGAGRPEPIAATDPFIAQIRTPGAHANSGIYHRPRPAGALHWGRVLIDDGTTGADRSYFVVVSDTTEGLAQANRQLRQIAILGAVGMVLALLVAWIIAGQILAPVRRLQAVTSAVDSSDLGRRVPVHGHDEIAQLAVTFNAMLDRLEAAYTTQRKFIDDAGHELRTPITVVRGQLELLEQSSPQQRARSVELATAELDRMSRMVNDLLTLAVADAGELVVVAPTDIAAMLIDLEDKAATISPRVVAVAVAEGDYLLDEQRITQALLELVRNALRYSSGPVEIGSTVLPGTAQQPAQRLRFWVRDHGPGVDSQAAEQLFQRFSRGRNQGRADGAGLGLSIVAAIAHGHGGAPVVDSEPGVGSRFAIEIPARAPGGLADNSPEQ